MLTRRDFLKTSGALVVSFGSAALVGRSVIAQGPFGTRASHVDPTRLESWIDGLDAELPPLRHFVLSGGTPSGAALHLARAVCRRAERAVLSLGAGAVEPVVVVYLTRVPDLLFTMARAANHRAGVSETEW